MYYKSCVGAKGRVTKVDKLSLSIFNMLQRFDKRLASKTAYGFMDLLV
jgi:hypothetical protein